jgi:uncharacterized protein (TIGR04255 family)
MSPERRRYRNPPLLEAVAEFRFAGESWDQTIPGLFFSKVSDKFPAKQQITAVDAAQLPDPTGALQQTFLAVERVRLMRADEAASISIGPHYLSISRTSPYEGWEEFEPLVADAVATYVGIAAPTGIQRIGLRYVNQIRFGVADRIELSTYFDFFPHLGDQLPQDHSSFICGVQFPFDEQRDLLKVQLADQPSTPGTSAMLLDLDYFLNRAGQVDLEDVPAWLSCAHERLEQVFEGSITDALRARFELVELET